MSAHTPGPWQYYELPPTFDGIGYIRPLDEDQKEIAHHGDEQRSAAENRANGRLIAAAPELLATLKNIVPRFRRCCIAAGSDEWAADCAVEDARALLARIDGAP